jgi:RHS repeat-associated protein
VTATLGTANAQSPTGLQFTQPGINDATAGVPETGAAAGNAALASASVDPATGMSGAGIPLAYPKARGDAQPRISIGYSSAAGQGFLGWGWGLSFPVVERTTLSGPPTYNDHFAASTPSDDRFAFNGQSLVPICQLGRSCGTTEPRWIPAGAWLFRLENDTMHAKFWWLPSTLGWIVQLPSGETLELGEPLEQLWPRFGADAVDFDPTQGTSTPAYRWYVVRQYDAQRMANGSPANPIVYAWAKLEFTVRSSPRSYLTDIFDTPAPDTSSARSMPNFAHHLHFDYEAPRSVLGLRVVDPPIWRSTPAFRLTGVDVTSADFGAVVPRKEVRRYHFAYLDYNTRSYLQSVTTEGRCDSAAAEDPATDELPPTSCPALKPTTFEYLLPETVPQTTPILGNIPDNATIFDFNSDGVPDFWGTANDSLWQPIALNGAGAAGNVVVPSTISDLPGSHSADNPVTSPSTLAAGVGRSDGKINAIRTLNQFDSSEGASFVGQSLFSPSLYTKSGSSGYLWTRTPEFSLTEQRLGVNGGQCDGSTVYVAGAESPIAMTDIDGDGLIDEVTSTEVYQASLQTDDNGKCQAVPNPGNVDAYFSARTTVLYPNGSTAPFSRLSANAVTKPTQVQVPDSIASIQAINQWPWLPSSTLADFYEDMNGDGLADLVILYPGQAPRTVGYLPGQGTGAVGLCPNGGTSCTNNERLDPSRAIWMTNAPLLPIENLSRVYAHDINGDGLADIIIALDTISVYLNLDGRSFGPKTLLEVRGYDAYKSSLMFADMNGSGVDDVVVVTNNEAVYVDLLSGQRPGLLRTIRNGRGATTTIEYASTVDLARCSRNASSGCTGPLDGVAWQSETPQVMHVVTKMSTTNNMPAPVTVNTINEYSYSDPVYDGRDRSFRGFRRVRQRKTSDPVTADDPPVTTETTFLVGRCEEDYPNGSCPESPVDRPFGAATGLPVIVETYDDQGHYASTVHTEYAVNLVQSGADGRTSYFAYPAETDTYLYDSSQPSTQSTKHTVNNVFFPGATGFAHPATGTLTVHGSRINRRGSFPAELLAVTTVEDGNGNVTHRTDWGRRGIDRPIVTDTTWIDPQGEPTGWMWRPHTRHLGASTDKIVSDVPRDTTIDYDVHGHPREVRGVVRGTVPLVRYNSAGKKIAPSPQSSTEGFTVLLQHIEYTPVGAPSLVYRANQNGCMAIFYDDAYQQLPKQKQVYIGANCTGPVITTNQQYDRGFEQVSLAFAANGGMSSVTFDPFGRPLTVSKPDPFTGALPSAPSRKIEYFDSDSAPQMVHTQEWDGAAYRDTWSYSDGLGNHLLTAHVADPVADNGSGWVVSDAKRLSPKGSVLGTYLPFFWGSVGTLGSQYPVQGGFPSSSTRMTFDAFGHLVDKYDMSGALVQHRVNHALTLDIYDGENRLGGRHEGAYVTVTSDGHMRNIAVLKRERLQGQWVGVTTNKTYTSAGQVAVITQTNGSQSVTRTAQYDSFGHMVANVEPNTSVTYPIVQFAWHYVYDDDGQLVGTSDARGCGENIAYDPMGRVVSEDFSPCADGQQDYSQPSGRDGTESYFVYDDDAALPAGHLRQVLDRGANTTYDYDYRDRVTTTSRAIAKPGLTDRAVSTRYADHVFTKRTEYDDLDRPSSEGTGADTDLPDLLGAGGTSAVTTRYSARGTVSAVNSSYGSLVSNATYDADGLLLTRLYGDGAGTTTTVQYDSARRPFKVDTTRAAPPAGWTGSPTQVVQLQALTQLYDVMGNPIFVHDDSNPSQWQPGAQPRYLTSLSYDDSYRISDVLVTFANGGTDSWVSPNQAEESAKDTTVLPIVGASAGTRTAHQTFAYDWLGNTQSTADDQNVFYDRSLGAISNNPPPGRGPNQLVAASLPGATGGTVGASYDYAGNLFDLKLARSGECPAPEGCNHRFGYTWDEVGQLVEARRWDYSSVPTDGGPIPLSGPLPSTPPSVDVQNIYDAGGHRVLRQTSAAGEQPSYTAEIFPTLRLDHVPWDGTSDYVRSAEKEQVYLSSNGSSLGRLRVTSSTTNLATTHVLLELADGLGSTTFVIDQATGELVERITYQPYGATESDFRPAGDFRETYRFTGKEEDREVGLVYFGARYYAPNLGRWISPDPKTIHQLSGDLNPYAYVGGNTLAAIDPDGMSVGGEGPPPDEFDPTTGMGTSMENSMFALSVYSLYNNASQIPFVGAAMNQIQFLNSLDQLDWSNPGFNDIVSSVATGAANSLYSLAKLAAGPDAEGLPSEILTPPRSASTNGWSMLASAAGGYASMEVLTGGIGMLSELGAARATSSAAAAESLAFGFCFAAGTPVWTERGQEPIEAVQPGELVLSRNQETGALEVHGVAQTFERMADDVLDLEVRDASGRSVHIFATAEHPFWLSGIGWTKTAALKVGDALWGTEGPAVVLAHHRVQQSLPVFNFEVEGTHAYLVSTAGLLVHNMCAATSAAGGEEGAARSLFHYTNGAGRAGILESEALNPSLKALNPADARYGNGQYLSDIVPGTKTPAQLSREFLGMPFQASRFTHYVEIDVTGLNVVQGRPGVFLIPNEDPLDLTGRIINSGPVP